MSFVLLGILNSQAAGGGAGATDFDLLETTTLASAASSVTFSGLGSYSDYKHLQIRTLQRTTGTGTGVGDIIINFNSDTSASYARHRLGGNGSSVFSGASTSVTSLTYGQTTPRDGEPAGVFGSGVMDILDFSSTNKNTTTRFFTGALNHIRLFSGLFFKTDAITSITFADQAGDFATGSRFSLYGVK